MKKTLIILLMLIATTASAQTYSNLDNVLSKILGSRENPSGVWDQMGETTKAAAKTEAASLLTGLDSRRLAIVASSTTQLVNSSDPVAYRCDAVDDEVQIQAAIDLVATSNYGGTVYLTDGVFRVGKNSASEELSGTADVSQYNTDYMKLDVGADHSKFAVGDMIMFTGGDNGGNTLEQNYLEGIYPVNAVSGGTLGATEISVAWQVGATYTDVTWVRPAWAIKLPPKVRLVGAGKLSTIIRLDANENCSVIWCSSGGVLTGGGQSIDNLAINALTQTGTWYKCNGVLTGAAYDLHIRDCEIRYFKGTGLCIGDGWGFRMLGGWIEDCQISVQSNGGPIFDQVKIQQAGYTGAGGANIILNKSSGTAQFNGCELRSDTDAAAAITLRGCRGCIVNGGVMQATATGHSCFAVYGVCRQLQTNGTQFDVVSTSANLIQLNNWLLGGRITGEVTYTQPTTLITNFGSYAGGLDIDLMGDYASVNNQAKSRNIGILNNSGGALVDGYAYCFDNTAATDAVRLPAAAGDAALVCGINNTYPTANGSRGYIVDYGLSQAAVTGTVVANDLLSLDTSGSAWGKLKTAGSGEIALARAIGAGTNTTIAVLVIAPRTLP